MNDDEMLWVCGWEEKKQTLCSVFHIWKSERTEKKIENIFSPFISPNESSCCETSAFSSNRMKQFFFTLKWQTFPFTCCHVHNNIIWMADLDAHQRQWWTVYGILQTLDRYKLKTISFSFHFCICVKCKRMRSHSLFCFSSFHSGNRR